MSIQVEHLTKIYGNQRAVDDISFTVNKGEIVGFLGPNGAGKSTTMKMITGYLTPDGGRARVCGVNVMDDPLGVKKRTGYLPESNPLYHDMYVREYLGFIADMHGLKNKKNIIAGVLEQVGLISESRKKIGQLSKGYKQRTGLAAALLHEPEVLILDEPTSGLDPNQIIEIRNVIRDQGRHKVVLFSSHILQEVEAVCDRVIIINRGRIVADDHLENLRQRSATNIVKVAFREPLEAEWLKRLEGVLSVDRIDSLNWSLETEDPEHTRKQLLRMALQHNLNIVSLHSEIRSLEEVFRSLTGSREKSA